MRKNSVEELVRKSLAADVSASTYATVAERIGLDAGYLCKVVKGKKGVTARLARAYGYDRQETIIRKVVYKKIA
jgi:uncharacterized protein involved in tellurium resistance